MVATRGRTFKRPWRRSCHSSKLKSSSAPIGRKDSWCFHAVGSSNAPLLGSTAAEGLQRIGRTSIATRWRSCGLPQSASCSENFVIPPDVFGQTLKTRRRGRNQRLLRGRGCAVVARIAAVGRIPGICAGNRPGGGQREADGGGVGLVAIHRDCLGVNGRAAGGSQRECDRSGGIGSSRKGRTVAERDAGCRKGNVRTRCAVPECRGISHADATFREALWDRFFTAAPRPRTPSELLYSDRRLRSKSSPAATILIRKR